MFGLIIGMSVFSALSLQWAKQELVRQQALNARREQAQAQDIAKGLEFSLLTETQGNYRDNLDLARALPNTALAGGKTRGGEKVLVVSRDDRRADTFGATNQRVAVTASDDILKRSELYRAGSAADLGAMAASRTVVMFDTSAIRAKQMKDSRDALEGMGEQLYAFYGAHLKFPSSSEYDELSRNFNFRDAWGEPFGYTYISDDAAQLEFTTPWNYTYTEKLTLKDDTGAQQ
jgi:hypothetical protein